MKESEKPVKLYKTLSGLEEELHPKGPKVDKVDLVGVDLLLTDFLTWKTEGKEAVKVIVTRMDTGELCHFNGGEPILRKIREYQEHIPFVCHVRSTDPDDVRAPWILE